MQNSVLFLLSLIATGFLINGYNGYKILGVFPTMAKSHFIVGSALMKGLAEKGHDVSVISPFPLKKPLKNYRDIPTTTIVEVTKDLMNSVLDSRKKSTLESFTSIFEMGEMITNVTLQERTIQDLLKSNEKFDIVIMEVFMNEAMLGLANHLKAPVIGVSTFGASLWVCEMVGSPSPISYVPSPFSNLPDNMDFMQRLTNLAMVTVERLIYDYYHIPKQVALYKKYFPNAKPSLPDLIRNVSLVLLNTHFSLSYPRPYAINMVEVGGMHLNRVKKPLPADLQEFLDSAKEGAIYFSMGSNIKGKTLDMDKVKAIIGVFRSLKQKVLWKWEDDVLPSKTSNIKISPWFPQDDVLAHPNVKLFITHGGLLSTTEAIYHGVPIVAIPIFGDQPLNAARAEKAGFARVLSYDGLTEDLLREAVLDILNNNKYERNVKKISNLYRDQPTNPLDKAIYWVEYVARHKGAVHMHSAGQELNFIQYHNLDLFATIIIVLVIFLYLSKKVFRLVCKSRTQMTTPVKSRKEKSHYYYKLFICIKIKVFKYLKCQKCTETMRNSVLFLLSLIATGFLINGNNGYKILGIFPSMAKSHFIVGSALMKGLAEKGHDVSVISPFPLKTPLKNYRDIPTTTILETTKGMMNTVLDMRKMSTLESFTSIFEMGEMITNVTLQERIIQDLMKSNEKFDVVIVEVFMNEALLGLANHLKAPVIGVSTFGASLWVCEMVGSPSPISYVPSPFSNLPDNMDFMQRLTNLAMVTVERLIYDYYHIPKQVALYKKYFPNAKPSLPDLIRNVSLVLLNTHFSLSYPRPYAINMVEVGGMHLNRVKKPLPADLQEFLDSAKEGAIYFSMGSNIKGKTLDMDKVKAIIGVFRSLKQKVLWKWEDDVLPSKTSNIKISPWFPQDDILAHPNVKLFITHGGLLSTTEAIYHGVPIVAIPIFGDQPLNAARAEKAGFARVLSYDGLTEDLLREAVLDILNNNKYERNVKKISNLYRDQPTNPLDKAIYWVEYVARHKGAVHMHSAGQELNFIQYHNLDLFATIIIVLVIFLYLSKKVFRLVCKSRTQVTTPVKSRKEKSH
ncbi:uncharacterized protein LOC119647761 [Hermetia illucens]|uniref:uncharacterized protein LOC119647761 n=1 Tax=Hermetia illucens TaxID=343691 RepID=UPI0018CBFC8C|nr:uncharacterized protein LOC119647761 [Hermetia illucens]